MTNKNDADNFINFVTGQTTTSKHLAGKHDQDSHGRRAGAKATPEQLAARKRVAANRAEEKKPAQVEGVNKPAVLGRGGHDAQNVRYSEQSMRLIAKLEDKFQLTDRDKKADWRHASGEWGHALEELNDIFETISGKRWPQTGWDRGRSAPEAMRIAKGHIAERLTAIRDWMGRNRTSDYSGSILETLDELNQIWL